MKTIAKAFPYTNSAKRVELRATDSAFQVILIYTDFGDEYVMRSLSKMHTTLGRAYSAFATIAGLEGCMVP